MDTALIAAVVSAVVSFIGGLLVNFQNRFQFFSTTVSKERMVWIKDMRQLCTDLCTVCEMNESVENNRDVQEKFLNARNGILIRLNPKEKYAKDKRLIELLSGTDFSDVKENIPEIREILMAICKAEWDKVKIEAGNNRRKVEQIRKIQADLAKEGLSEAKPSASSGVNTGSKTVA